ncbi:hypothetical protein CPY51_28160 [Rhizobium tubonense]|uniref:Uncharacterized protein n=2 Tax=Rhizobium tubonense TaxID=484088 RepID=A0A2W4C7A1_9HYPH|nr:hypothetical protein CPY51_28160 [Rhizobium tubonense]
MGNDQEPFQGDRALDVKEKGARLRRNWGEATGSSFDCDISSSKRSPIEEVVEYIANLSSTLLLALLLVTSIGVASARSTEANTLGTVSDGTLGMCASLKGFSVEYCRCVIRTSKEIDENDTILAFFLANVQSETKGREVYRAIIDGDTFNEHNFSAVRQKKDFVEGQSRLFVHRIQLECSDIK